VKRFKIDRRLLLSLPILLLTLRRGWAACGIPSSWFRETPPELRQYWENAVSRRYFVMFFARESSGGFARILQFWRAGIPGHSFVMVGADISTGMQNMQFGLAAFGFYIESSGALAELKEFGKSIFSVLPWIGVRGELSQRLDDLESSVKLKVLVDEEEFGQAACVIQKWKSTQSKYNLTVHGGKNCNVFVSELASALCMKVPKDPGTTLPLDYIGGLRSLNGDRDVLDRRSVACGP
jgi:hypothetical protein